MENQPQSHHDKWMTIIMWVALLLSLVITSYIAWQSVILTQTFSSVSFSLSQSTEAESVVRSDIITLGGVFVLGAMLLLTWWRFGEMSLEVLQAFATDESPFEALLTYPLRYIYDKEADRNEDFDPHQAQNTTVGSVLRLIGMVWVIVLLTPPVVYILSKASA
jgi:hypothetical protein